MTEGRPAAVWYLLLWAPGRVQRRLDALVAKGRIEAAPSLWQVWTGVLYMWWRVAFRSETIGLSDGTRVRDTLRARLLDRRAFRLPALLWERAVNPLDQVGLGSSPEHVIRHLLGAYHPGANALYDLGMLDVDEGALEALRDKLAGVVDGTDPRAAWLRDLVVYEGYHERLLALVDRWLAEGPDALAVDHPDTTLPPFLAWCRRRPDGLAATLAALKEGRFTLAPDAPP
jgi:hypothetical protein